jgi:hypothetical protein
MKGPPLRERLIIQLQIEDEPVGSAGKGEPALANHSNPSNDRGTLVMEWDRRNLASPS